MHWVVCVIIAFIVLCFIPHNISRSDCSSHYYVSGRKHSRPSCHEYNKMARQGLETKWKIPKTCEEIKNGYQPSKRYDENGNLIEATIIPPTGGTSMQDE